MTCKLIHYLTIIKLIFVVTLFVLSKILCDKYMFFYLSSLLFLIPRLFNFYKTFFSEDILVFFISICSFIMGELSCFITLFVLITYHFFVFTIICPIIIRQNQNTNNIQIINPNRNNPIRNLIPETDNQNNELISIINNYTSLSDIYTDDICVICLESMNINDQIIKFNCNHIYHKKCISEWVLINDNCPICKDKLHISNTINPINPINHINPINPINPISNNNIQPSLNDSNSDSSDHYSIEMDSDMESGDESNHIIIV